jgi:CheY-like chemotaxis protein/predicted regulator of Ras-like GTPase activity (Roadblock/LC7/MglB family)
MGTATGRQVWRVLVVDDEENLNWSLVTSLRKDDYAADGALTGEDALRRMAGQPYDIVISDVKMPGMDGFELLQWLRANRPQTRVMMMTAFGSPTDRAEALRTGAIAYLEKPFDLHALKEELRRLTSGDQRSAAPGESAGYDLLEVARVISLARRDIALAVESNGRSGRLRFLRGDLIWAEAGDLRGDDAFVALTTPRLGRVQPEPWDLRSARNIMQPLSRLIYLALAQRDRPATATAGTSAGATMTATRGADAAPPSLEAVTSAATTQLAPRDARVSDGAASTVAGNSGGPLNAPSTSTASVSPVSPAQARAAGAVLDELATALPEPCGAVLLRLDGSLVAQRWTGGGEVAAGIHAHLAACAQAALRALLLGDWGDLEDVLVTSQTRYLLARRLGRTDRAVLVVVVAPRTADLAACRGAVHDREPALLDAMR